MLDAASLVFYAYGQPLCSAVCAFRHEYRPIDVALSVSRHLAGRTEQERRSVPTDPVVLAIVLEVHGRALRRSLAQAGSRRALEKLEQRVMQLKCRELRVVFVEMPVHPRLYAALLPAEVCPELRRRAPLRRYRYIELQKCGKPETTDPLHLSYRNAESVAGYLRGALAGQWVACNL